LHSNSSLTVPVLRTINHPTRKLGVGEAHVQLKPEGGCFGAYRAPPTPSPPLTPQTGTVFPDKYNNINSLEDGTHLPWSKQSPHFPFIFGPFVSIFDAK
jgi:hypothetical protein